MFRALVKTRFQAAWAAMFQGGRKKKGRSRLGVAGYVLLMLYVAACFFYLFHMMASQLCAPLLGAGLGWLYFALTGTMALAISVVGSVFTAQTQLYEAKDNELLLSMPIPPRLILGSRMAALYGQNLLFAAFVLLPALVVYLTEASPSPLAVVFYVLILLLLPLLSLTLSCILGWLVALVSARMRHKSLITVLLSLALLAVYFYFYTRLQYYLELLVANSAAVGDTIRRALFPLYQMGQAAQGDAGAFGLFALCVLVPFALVYWVLARSFLRIATTHRGAAKIRYRERTLKVSSPRRALLGKELRLFWSSPTYMLNGALGSVFLLVGEVALLVKQDDLLGMLALLPGLSDRMPLLFCLLLCLVISMNLITSPSISLEGKRIWQLQSMPLDGWMVLRGKLALHETITALPALVCSAAVVAVFRPDPAMAALLVVTPQVFSLLCAILGLVINLLLPRLDWTSEAQAIKRSGSAVLSMFANWGIALALAALYLLLGESLGDAGFVLVCTLLMVLAVWLLTLWLRRRGAAIFAHL